MSYFFIIAAAILFAFGSISAYYKKFSYSLSLLGAISVFVGGIYGINENYVINLFNITNKIKIQIGLDHMSALFIVIASLSWIAIALYSIDYGENYSKRMPLFFNAVYFGMLLVFTSRDALCFLAGWEITTIFLYLLIIEHKNSFKEAFDFLAFSEVSTISLIVAFAILYMKNGSFSFIGSHVGSFFIFMASIGFITKMDIYPLHIWISKTYPKSPSNVASLLSGPLTLMSAYGLMRMLTISNQPEWWGVAAMLLGGFSAFWGGLQAAAAKKLKLLPAYSTVENNGMILAAIGLSVTAYNAHIYVLSDFATLTSVVLLFAHNIAKSLLFLSVGHAKEALEEESIDNVRGIWSSVGKIPAISMVVSAMSFSAFPPFIGFIAEWMILEALFQSYKFPSILDRLSAAFSGILIALAMGLAAFSMAKLAGYTALGYDHEKTAKKIHSNFMNISEIFLISIISLVGLLSPLFIQHIGYGKFLSGLLGVLNPFLIVSSRPIFGVVSPTFLTIVIVTLSIFPFSFYWFKRKKIRRVNAWNGGEILKENEYFSVPAYSFILEFILRKVYSTKEIKKKEERYVSIEDITDIFYKGLIAGIKKISIATSRTLMNGHVYYYILYAMVMFTLVFFLVK